MRIRAVNRQTWIYLIWHLN